MTNPKESPAPEPRRLACSRCGTEFGCDLSGNCWCADETAKLPMPVEGEDCLCRECLRKAAAEAREGRHILGVVPANAGTHNPREKFGED